MFWVVLCGALLNSLTSTADLFSPILRGKKPSSWENPKAQPCCLKLTQGKKYSRGEIWDI